LQEPLFSVALVSDLQFHIERKSQKNLLGFFLRYVVLRNVSQVGHIPIKKQRLAFHNCS